MGLGSWSPKVCFQSGWTTHDVVRLRALAPGVEIIHWRAVRQSGEVAWIAAYPCDEDNFRIQMVLNRIPRHVGLPKTAILEAYAEGGLLVGFEVPEGLRPLGDRLRGGRAMPREERLACLDQVAQALDALHARGVSHRNLAPEAVLWDGEFALLLDSGWPDPVDLGAGEEAAQRLAPERRAGAEPDARSDQYLLAMLWLAMSGDGADALSDLPRALARRPLREQAALKRALDAEPGKRFPSCHAFTEALRADLGLEPPAPAECTRVGRAWFDHLFPPPPPPPVPLSLEQYRALVRPLGRPTAKQIDAYVDYLVTKHSWYKHLPALAPGVVFTVFINPMAGMIRSGLDEAHMEWCELGADDPIWHYSMMPTAEYRQRFGHLGYGSTASPEFSLYGADRQQAYGAEPRYFDTSEGRFVLPREVAIAGSTEVTAVIHPYARSDFVWNNALGMPPALDDLPAGAWPDRSGGLAVLRQIAECAARGDVDGIEALIVLERAIQHAELRTAARRMVALCFD